jgi:hypothetical protein
VRQVSNAGTTRRRRAGSVRGRRPPRSCAEPRLCAYRRCAARTKPAGKLVALREMHGTYLHRRSHHRHVCRGRQPLRCRCTVRHAVRRPSHVPNICQRKHHRSGELTRRARKDPHSCRQYRRGSRRRQPRVCRHGVSDKPNVARSRRCSVDTGSSRYGQQLERQGESKRHGFGG